MTDKAVADYNSPVLVVEPDPGDRSVLSDLLTSQGQSVDAAGDVQSALVMLARQTYKLVVAAPNGFGGPQLMASLNRVSSPPPVIILADSGNVREAVSVIQSGAMDYLVKPLTDDMIQEILGRLAELARLTAKADQKPDGSGRVVRDIVTEAPNMLELLDMAQRVAPSRATVLISGESGTGKELFARYIHAHSDRAAGPFVAVNCAALPENLLESELFGHEKGSFTGAISRKAGKFELADGGTLLLDEVSEMAPALQAKLLRVLQEGEVDRVGGRAPVPVDVRVVATTNRQLEKSVEEGDFRQDLYYRLNVIPVKLPALRHRRGDVNVLAEYFLKKYSSQVGKIGARFANETVDALNAHHWQGNVRELENIIERSVLLARSDLIEPRDLLLDVTTAQTGETGATVTIEAGRTLREMERNMIEAALDETRGNRTHAAKMLGISVRTLRNKLNEYKHDAAARGSQAQGA